MHRKVEGSVPEQGMDLGCRFDPWSEYIREVMDGCFSLHPFLSLLKSVNISLSENLK